MKNIKDTDQNPYNYDSKTKEPNEETKAALLEAERISKDPMVKAYDNVDELFTDFISFQIKTT